MAGADPGHHQDDPGAEIDEEAAEQHVGELELLEVGRRLLGCGIGDQRIPELRLGRVGLLWRRLIRIGIRRFVAHRSRCAGIGSCARLALGDSIDRRNLTTWGRDGNRSRNMKPAPAVSRICFTMWRKSKSARAQRPSPPRAATWLLARRLHDDERDCVLGDLAEEFRDVQYPCHGRRRARRWYWGQTLRTIFHGLSTGARAHPPAGSLPAGASAPRTALGSGDGFMSTLFRDLRYGVRTLLQTPTFTALTILTLGLAIGVNTAIFSMVNVLMFQPLPFRHTEDIAFFYFDNPERGVQDGRMSPGDFFDYRERLTSFRDLGAVNRGRGVVITGVDEPERIVAWEATANVFDIWGVEPVLGRSFLPGEDQIGAPRVVMLTHGTWERRFGADPEVLGRTVKLDGFETTIIGVLGHDLEFGSLASADLWMPLYLDRATASRDSHSLWTSGRLREGVTYEQAGQETALLAQSLIEEHPETNAGWVVRVEDIDGTLANDQVWTIFYMLMLTVAFVIAIACSNIATMMLARASSRSKEIAVRAALGARRSRILSQLLTESLLLSAAAGALGLLTTRVCLSALVWMEGENSGTNFFSLLSVDRNVLLFTAAVALFAPLMFGFLPALRASRADLNQTLNDSSRGSSGMGGLRGRRVLVATQVSLALSLMVVAGLLIRSMVDQRLFDLGYETEGILTLRLDLPDGKYPEEHQWQPFFDEVMDRVAALPAVDQAGWIDSRPLADGPPSSTFLIEGADIPETPDLPFASVSVATQSALEVLRLPVVRGRGFDASDSEESMPVVLVNEDMVERYWNGEDPVGRRLRFGGADSTEPWRTIVGVVGNVFSGNPDSPSFPVAVLPLRQNPRAGLGMVLRPVGEEAAAVPAIRRAVWAVDAEQPLGDVRTLTQIFNDNLATFSTIISIFIVFAVFALIMAATGIYGVISFSVSQRTQEIGIRMALGAHGNDVMRMISRQALWLVGIGLAIGAAGAFVLGRIVAGVMPGLSASDPWALMGVALALLGSALIAIWVPARRAVRIDPIIALRQE